jgi:hypothetical protein
MSMTDDFLNDYDRLIESRYLAYDGKPFPNGTLRHAGMIVDAMFRHAKKRVRILTGELNARAYGTPYVIDSALQFLANSDHSLEIIFEGQFDDGEARRHPLLAMIGTDANVILYRLREDQRANVKSHFALMDDASYRYEADKRRPSAIAAFNDKTFAEQLTSIFEALRDKASDRFAYPA